MGINAKGLLHGEMGMYFYLNFFQHFLENAGVSLGENKDTFGWTHSAAILPYLSACTNIATTPPVTLIPISTMPYSLNDFSPLASYWKLG